MASHHLDKQDESLSRGFNQGHFAFSIAALACDVAALANESRIGMDPLETAWRSGNIDRADPLVRAGFVLGFYSCMSIDDILSRHFAEWTRALETAAPYIRLLVSAVPPGTCNPSTIENMQNGHIEINDRKTGCPLYGLRYEV